MIRVLEHAGIRLPMGKSWMWTSFIGPEQYVLFWRELPMATPTFIAHQTKFKVRHMVFMCLCPK
jgi:hypothetical protein